jgi:hypothetical protein
MHGGVVNNRLNQQYRCMVSIKDVLVGSLISCHMRNLFSTSRIAWLVTFSLMSNIIAKASNFKSRFNKEISLGYFHNKNRWLT